MGVSAEGAQYLVIFKLKDFSAGRLQRIVPRIQSLLERASKQPIEPALRSISGDLFGYFIRSSLSSKQIKALIESPARGFRADHYNPDEMPVLSNEDAIMILQIGEDFIAGVGFTRAGTWLQRH